MAKIYWFEIMILNLSDNLLLLDASYDLRDIVFNEQKERYEYPNGRKVPDAQLRRMMKKDTQQQAQNIEYMTKEMLAGRMSYTDWQRYMATKAKDQEIKYMVLGRGGKNQTYAIHYLDAGNQLRTVHYPALNKFAQQITEGNLSEAQIIARARQYANHIPAYERGKMSRIKDRGGNMVARRRLGSCANHCADCIMLAQRGWLPINQVPPPGQGCRCRGNCCCSIEVWNGQGSPPA